MRHHFGEAPTAKPDETANHRNGSNAKTVLPMKGRCRWPFPANRQVVVRGLGLGHPVLCLSTGCPP
jgi:hypothetical protein